MIASADKIYLLILADARLLDERFILVDGNKIRYLDSSSDRPPLVLIHGLGASAERWEFVVPILRRHFRVVVPDLIGFGLSDKPLADYTPDFFADFLEGFFERTGVAGPSLIGSSLGGHIAAEYCSRDSSSVEKLILVSPSGVMKTSTPALDAYIMAALYPSREGAKNAFQEMTGSPRKIDLHIIDGFVQRMQMPNAKMAFMSTLLGLKNADMITAKLRSIETPTLIVWGGRDPVIPIEHAEHFVSSIRDCRFLRMDFCGHTPYVEDPDRFCQVVLGFLKGPGGLDPEDHEQNVNAKG